MKKKYKKIIPVTLIITLTATFLVVFGVALLKYGLYTNNTFWIALSPDIVGGGVLIFSLMIATIIIGLFGLKIKMKYT